jgi:hypothetical protein
MTPLYLVQWTPPGYVEIYVGPKGLERLYMIGTSGKAYVMVPPGQCLYALRIDAHGKALSAKTPEDCPGKITKPPTYIKVQ